MFDPTIGRWFQEDPIGFDANDPNLYEYVGNSPTNATDPSGMMGWSVLSTWPPAQSILAAGQPKPKDKQGLIDDFARLAVNAAAETVRTLKLEGTFDDMAFACWVAVLTAPDTAPDSTTPTADRLKISDFPIRKVSDGAEFDAFTAPRYRISFPEGIEVTVRPDPTGGFLADARAKSVRFEALFNTDLSYVRPVYGANPFAKDSKELLEHERIHLAIGELIAAIATKNFPRDKAAVTGVWGRTKQAAVEDAVVKLPGPAWVMFYTLRGQ